MPAPVALGLRARGGPTGALGALPRGEPVTAPFTVAVCPAPYGVAGTSLAAFIALALAALIGMGADMTGLAGAIVEGGGAIACLYSSTSRHRRQ